MPARNLHVVQDCVTDAEACFAEPLAAALRIIEQQLCNGEGQRIAVLGDGKLGLLITAALTATMPSQQSKSKAGMTTIFLFGRHGSKLDLLREMQRSVKDEAVRLVLANVKTEQGKRKMQEGRKKEARRKRNGLK